MFTSTVLPQQTVYGSQNFGFVANSQGAWMAIGL